VPPMLPYPRPYCLESTALRPRHFASHRALRLCSMPPLRQTPPTGANVHVKPCCNPRALSSPSSRAPTASHQLPSSTQSAAPPTARTSTTPIVFGRPPVQPPLPQAAPDRQGSPWQLQHRHRLFVHSLHTDSPLRHPPPTTSPMPTSFGRRQVPPPHPRAPSLTHVTRRPNHRRPRPLLQLDNGELLCSDPTTVGSLLR
jgi:hypothetical protein